MSINRSISLLGGAAALVGLLLTGAACARKAPSTASPEVGTTAEAGSPVLGGAASPTSSSPGTGGGGGGGTGTGGPGGGGTPGGGGGGGTTGGPVVGGGGSLVLPSPGPHSTLASMVGFTWSYNASSTYTAVGSYQYNSAGGPITITHVATGSYRVAFGGLGTAGGVAHAQAYGSNANSCAVNSWYPDSGAQVVNVRCFNGGGTAVDSQFVANFARGSEGTARFAYLWAEQPANPSLYHPSAAYRYDAVDSAGITVDRTGTGQYDVYLPAAGPTLGGSWHFQITAYAASNRCKVIGFYAPTRTANVVCRTAVGALADTKFSMSFASQASILGRTSVPFINAWGSNSVPASEVEHLSTGVYIQHLTGYPGDARGHVEADSLLNGSDYCHIVSWSASGPDLQARVACFSPGGAPTDAVFYVAGTW